MKRFLIFVLLVAAGLAGAHYMGWVQLPIGGQVAQTAQRAFGGRRAQQKTEEPPVLVATVKRQDVPITLDAVGTIQALNMVVVRAQVDGRLMELKFRDGQDVKKGDVLARIDPATYQAQYDQAVAKKAQDEAQLANARVDLDRYTKLAVGNFGSKQQADTQKALVAQYAAQVQVDQASIDNFKAILNYTTIAAPIDGRTGLRAIDAGNIVHANDSNGIVSITQVQPIAAIFNLPQQQLRPLNAGLARGKMVVQSLDDDNTTVVDTGQIEVVDNQVDSTTGTVRVKASFPNANKGLWPGQFVNIRVLLDTLPQAITVPTAAVQRGPKGPFVYVVGEDRKAVMTSVVVGRQDEHLAVLTSGVESPMRVVTAGFSQISDGTIVKPTSAADAATPVAATTPAPGTDPTARRGGGNRQGGAGGGQGRRQGGNAAPGTAPRAGASETAGAAAAAQ
jgi:multidrug efflux system membrane fusion protein